jgi:hypothetical protein
MLRILEKKSCRTRNQRKSTGRQASNKSELIHRSLRYGAEYGTGTFFSSDIGKMKQNHARIY